MFVLHILRFFHNSTDFPDFSCPKSPEIPKKSKIGEKSGKKSNNRENYGIFGFPSRNRVYIPNLKSKAYFNQKL